MSSSFFYSQDHDCSVCSSSLHPTLLSPSLMSSWDEVSSIIDLYWQDDPHMEVAEIEQTTMEAQPIRPALGARKTSDHSAPSIRSIPSLLSSSASTISTSSSSPSSPTASTFSRRFRLKKAISSLSLHHSSSDHNLGPRSAKSEDGKTPVSNLLPPTSHPAREDERAGSVEDEIHPYNFFEASLHMGADYSIFEDGWLRLRTGSRFR